MTIDKVDVRRSGARLVAGKHGCIPASIGIDDRDVAGHDGARGITDVHADRLAGRLFGAPCSGIEPSLRRSELHVGQLANVIPQQVGGGAGVIQMSPFASARTVAKLAIVWPATKLLFDVLVRPVAHGYAVVNPAPAASTTVKLPNTVASGVSVTWSLTADPPTTGGGRGENIQIGYESADYSSDPSADPQVPPAVRRDHTRCSSEGFHAVISRVDVRSLSAKPTRRPLSTRSSTKRETRWDHSFVNRRALLPTTNVGRVSRPLSPYR